MGKFTEQWLHQLPEEVQNQIEEAESAIQQTLEGVPTGPSVQYNIYDILLTLNF